MANVGVFATVFDRRGRVVCVKQNYPPYMWTTPGGKLEMNEAPTDGLLREVLEETGYEIQVCGLVGVYAAPFKDDIVLGFKAEILKRRDWKPNEEISAVELFSPINLPKPMKLNTAQRIQDAANQLQGVYRDFRTAAEHGAISGDANGPLALNSATSARTSKGSIWLRLAKISTTKLGCFVQPILRVLVRQKHTQPLERLAGSDETAIPFDRQENSLA